MKNVATRGLLAGRDIAMSKYQGDLSSSPASLSPWSFPPSVPLLPAWKYSA